MYKICFYVPETHLEIVKNALFSKGAGKVGSSYHCCAWQTLGEGQFMPLEGSTPFIGKVNTLEKVSEFKVEMICQDQYIHDVIAEFRKTHPYEEPGYDVWRVEEFN